MPQESAVVSEGLEFYIILVWLFVFIVTILMIFLCCLYLAMRRSQERETQSLAFSHLVIEGLERERRRVSRELHDSVLPLLRDSVVSDLIRSICMELSPPDFSRLSLKDALADACAKCTARTGIECACSIEENLDLKLIKPDHQLHLYRMVQEALTNIEKHSMATRASLVARRTTRGSEECLLICVSDDGRGLYGEPDEAPAGFGRRSGSVGAQADSSGLGLRSMRQRAAIIGAALDFKSETGNGLMVRVKYPIPIPPPPPAKFTKFRSTQVSEPALARRKRPLAYVDFYYRRPSPCA